MRVTLRRLVLRYCCCDTCCSTCAACGVAGVKEFKERGVAVPGTEAGCYQLSMGNSQAYGREARSVCRRQRVVEPALNVLLTADKQRSAHCEGRWRQLSPSHHSLRTTPMPQLNTSEVVKGSASLRRDTYASR